MGGKMGVCVWGGGGRGSSRRVMCRRVVAAVCALFPGRAANASPPLPLPPPPHTTTTTTTCCSQPLRHAPCRRRTPTHQQLCGAVVPQLHHVRHAAGQRGAQAQDTHARAHQAVGAAQATAGAGGATDAAWIAQTPLPPPLAGATWAGGDDLPRRYSTRAAARCAAPRLTRGSIAARGRPHASGR
jgi:hypothetical protein